jgi:hypothetical protein
VTTAAPDLVEYPANVPGVLDLGARHFVRPCGDPPTWWMWWHDCATVTHTAWGWIGDQGDKKSGHRIASTSPLHVEGSLVCEDCGDHGWIHDGRWVKA